MQAPTIIRRTAIACALALVAVSSDPRSALAKKQEPAPQEEQIDYVALAARLLKDGHFDRAEATLTQVDPKNPSVDWPRFHTLSGLVQLQLKKHAAAREHFRKAIASGQQEPVVFLYLAQAHYGLKDYEGVIGALHKAGDVGRDVPGTFLMRSQAHWELDQRAAAFTALDQAMRAFPKQGEFMRIKLFYLIDLGLFQEVSRIGEAYLARTDATSEDFAAVGEGLRQSKQFDAARQVLEAARLRYPDDKRLLLLLAHCYLDDGHPLTAAMLFEEAARQNPRYALEAAELYLKANRMERALANNARIVDQKAKMKQRLSILLRMERFGMVAGMEDRLSRLGLLSDESIRYALAYGYFKVGEFNQSESHLKQLTEAKLFDNATELRKAIESCRQSGWECN